MRSATRQTLTLVTVTGQEELTQAGLNNPVHSCVLQVIMEVFMLPEISLLAAAPWST